MDGVREKIAALMGLLGAEEKPGDSVQPRCGCTEHFDLLRPNELFTHETDNPNY